MLRKIRRFYWKQRDRGLGRQTVMAAVGAALFLMIILGAVTKNVIMPKMRVRKMLREPRLPVELLSEPGQHPEEVLR